MFGHRAPLRSECAKCRREFCESREDAVKAMNLEQPGGARVQTGKADIAAGLQKLATQQNKSCKSCRARVLRSAHINNNRLSGALCRADG